MLARTLRAVTYVLARATVRAAKFAGIPLRDPALVALFGSRDAISGIHVDEKTALTHSAVWQAVTLLSSTKAMLPMHVVNLTGGANRLEVDHPTYRLLRHAPNPEMTAYTYHETMQQHKLTHGNAYAEIEWGTDNLPFALWPITPDRVNIQRNTETYELEYIVYPSPESREQRIKTLRPRDIIHVPGMGFDGVKGYAPIRIAANSIGLGLAAESYGGKFFGHGGLPSGFVVHPGALSKEAKNNLRESWQQIYGGPDNANRIGILDEGMSFNKLTIPPEDAQFLQTRAFQIPEIARWFNVPPHLLRDLSQATFSNIEHQGIDFLTYSLTPWLIRDEEEYQRKLFPNQESVFGITHDTSRLLATDVVARFNAYKSAREGGWYSLNDIRRRENMPLIKTADGDALLVPLNMQVLGEHLLPGSDSAAIGEVALTALNGGQVTALLAIVQAASATDGIPIDAAVQMVQIAFPTVSPEQAKALFDAILTMKRSRAEMDVARKQLESIL